MDWKGMLLAGVKIAANVALQNFLPGASGIFQLIEDFKGPKTGAEKFQLAFDWSKSLLTSLGKSGQLNGPVPTDDELKKLVQSLFDATKLTGTLVESKSGLLDLGEGEKYSIIVVGKL